ncbi:MAG: carbohydrate ABC transporter permease [Leifsonia sp.]
MNKKRPSGRWGIAIGTTLLVIFILAPIYWMLATSLKSDAALSAKPPQLVPLPINFQNYVTAFAKYSFGTFFLSSVIVSVASTILVLALGTFAGYALARLPLRGKFPMLVALLMISVFPAVALLAPLYLIMRNIGWLNSYQALIVPYTALHLPFAIWILRNYFLAVPREIEESATVDGASTFRTLLSVVLPTVLPGVFTAGVFSFTACWTEFLMALTFNSDNTFRTIPVGIALFGTEYTTPYGVIFAASAVAVVPITILVFVFRKSVVSGLTSGAIKG